MENYIGVGSSSVLYLGAWFVFFYLYHGYGITLGYHRLLTHKALVVPRWLMYLIVSGGYLCLMGSPIVWVGVHRLHHQKSDIVGEDPHTPQEGFFHAFLGWMTKMRGIQTDEDLQRQVKDLMADPILRMFGYTHSPGQALLCLVVVVLYNALLFIIFGAGVMLMNVLATLTVFMSPHLVNTICHIPRHGYRNYATKDRSRNVWWVGLMALGEGWHNNHHHMPTSARHGFKWFEIDATWYFVLLLEKLQLAKKVVRPTQRLEESMPDPQGEPKQDKLPVGSLTTVTKS